MNELDRWAEIVKPLVMLSSRRTTSIGIDTPQDRRKSRARSQDDERQPGSRHALIRCTAISPVERNERKRALISWSDPTRGHYVEQVWIFTAARNMGHCALTGRHIRKGDPVYKPWLKGMSKPFNGSDMILAAELDLALGRDAQI